VLLTRTWLRNRLDGIPLEIATTGFRAVTIVVYWLMSRDLILSRRARRGAYRGPLLVAAIGPVLLAPVLFGDASLPDLPTKLVFASTSIVVGVREEFFYRGIVQNILDRRAGWWMAIVISNALFTLYHYRAFGVPPFTFPVIVGYFAVGSALGLIYLGTRSLVLVIAIHTVYDVLWALTPLIAHPGPFAWAVCLDVLGALLLLLWVARCRTAAVASR
jgi:membrane protease YdiL (CAAX protease family)